MVDPFEKVNIVNEALNFVLVLRGDGVLVILKHEKIIFNPDGNILLFVPAAHGLLVGLLSEVNEAVDEGDFDFLDRVFIVLEDEAI